MYRKFLLKKQFWAVPSKNGQTPNCYVRHDIRSGGIYAYLQHRGVKIVANNETEFFNNFETLEKHLDKLIIMNSRQQETSDFLSILNRRNTSKVLRSLPI
jgi:hypothetical protein